MSKLTKEEINAKIAQIQNTKLALEKQSNDIGKELAVAEATFNSAKNELLALCPEHTDRINSGDFESLSNAFEAELEKVLEEISQVEASTENSEIKLD